MCSGYFASLRTVIMTYGVLPNLTQIIILDAKDKLESVVLVAQKATLPAFAVNAMCFPYRPGVYFEIMECNIYMKSTSSATCNGFPSSKAEQFSLIIFCQSIILLKERKPNFLALQPASGQLYSTTPSGNQVHAAMSCCSWFYTINSTMKLIIDSSDSLVFIHVPSMPWLLNAPEACWCILWVTCIFIVCESYMKAFLYSADVPITWLITPLWSIIEYVVLR